MMRKARLRMALLALVLAGAGAGLLALAPPWVAALQAPLIDRLALLAPEPRPARPVVVVDIGARDDLGRVWDRQSSARLAARFADAGPAVVGWDMVFSGGCTPGLPDAALAAALGRVPSVLGFLLSGSGQRPEAPAPVIALTGPLPPLWSAPGAEAPCPGLAGAATLGAVALIGDDAARVRAVPVAMAVAGTVWPALPVEMLRRAGLGLPVLDGAGALRLGPARLALDSAGQMRFRPSGPDRAAARTLDAAALLAGTVPPERLAGALVLVGSSLPQRGGLRATAAGPLTPSVQIWADALEAMAAGQAPQRPARAPVAEALALLVAGVAVALAMLRLAPVPAFAVAAGLAAVWPLAALALAQAHGLLLDPALPPVLLVLAALSGLLLGTLAATRAERALRGRMRQLLPDAVVTRLAEDPALLRLKGERREITALFTDLEGFTALTNDLPPERLIALLDRYFATVTPLVLAHGGMIDKIVGDAVHAFFNAPLDQPGHARAALDCAAAILAATEALRMQEPALGRTRIGVETGPAVLGDVGSAARIDYTAHGPAVNLAARLQDAAKVLGPSVIVGPGTAAAVAGQGLRPLGDHPLRGFGMLALFTPAS